MNSQFLQHEQHKKFKLDQNWIFPQNDPNYFKFDFWITGSEEN